MLREGYRLRDLENRVLKKISGAMWGKVRGEKRERERERKKEELHDLYSTPNII